MAAKFVLTTDKAGEIRFALKAANGEIVLVSEGYSAKTGAMNGIESVRANAPDDARYERKTTSSGKPMFNLKAPNGQVIGTSESYSSTDARETGIAAVKRAAAEAEISDET